MTRAQLEQWHADRERQARIFHFHKSQGSRGDWQRRANNGLALRTFQAIKQEVR